MRKIFILLLFFVLFAGCTCQRMPRQIEGELLPCYYFRDCMYRNAGNKDKSVCIDYAKECRSFIRMNKCNSDRPEDMKFNDCWLYLNQK